MNQTLITIAFIISSVACTTVANLLLKVGALESGFGNFWPISILNWRILSGATFFGLAMLCYIMVLKRVPLNLAQTIFATQFVVVIIAARLVLNEPITITRWMGITLIGIGLIVIAYSTTTNK